MKNEILITKPVDILSADVWIKGKMICGDEETTSSVLKSDEAKRLWKIAQDKGWVDENLMPKLRSWGKASIIAYRMAEILNLKPRWKPFEELWQKEGLATVYSKAQSTVYYFDEFKKQVEQAMHL